MLGGGNEAVFHLCSSPLLYTYIGSSIIAIYKQVLSGHRDLFTRILVCQKHGGAAKAGRGAT